jgi:hypothetical protein
MRREGTVLVGVADVWGAIEAMRDGTQEEEEGVRPLAEG